MRDGARTGDRFPDGFVWGTATASYQIEGAVREDGRRPSIWDIFSHTPGKVVGGDTGDIACDHYHRWAQDVVLMRDLGMPAYRFSVAWPRVIPAGVGAINNAGLDYYDRLVEGLLESGIEPWLTLYHWDLPQALQEEGGLTQRDIAGAFGDYTEAVTRRLGDRVRNWITINEPWCAAFLGYWHGVHAPGGTSPAAGLAAAHNLLRMHGTAIDVVRATVTDARVGISLNPTSVYPLTDSAADEEKARRVDGLRNRLWLDALYTGQYPDDIVRELEGDMPAIEEGDMALTSRPTDFLGVNYYTPDYVSANPDASQPDGERTAMGWLIEPEGLTDLLERLHRDYAPGELYITENGSAWDDPAPIDGRVRDPKRVSYFQAHLAACLDAIDAGVPLRGYFAWSLLDNFEWAEGYSKRFGIVHVDYATQRRTAKDSALWFSHVVESNAIVDQDDID